MNVWDGINSQIGKLHSAVGKMVSVQQAEVTSVSPLRVRPDYHTLPLDARPANYCGPLEIGDRVIMLRFGRRAAIIGKAGGWAATQAEVNAGIDDTKYVTPKTLADRGVSYAVTPGAGFSIYNDWPVELIVKDGWAHLHVTLYYSGSGSATSLLSVPVGARPTSTRAIGYSHMSGGASRIHGVLLITSAGNVGFLSTYNEGTLLAGQYVPVVGSWRVA